MPTHPGTPSSAPGGFIPRGAFDDRALERHERARERQYRHADARLTHQGAFLALVMVISGYAVLGWCRILPTAWLHPHSGAAVRWGWCLCILIALYANAYWLIHEVRHAGEAIPVTLPTPTPPRVTFFDDEYLVGVDSWTEGGKQPGDVLAPAEAVLEPHIYMSGRAALQNGMATGQPDSGKTRGYIELIAAQAVRKYPVPPPVPRDAQGMFIPVPAWASPEHERIRKYAEGFRHRLLTHRFLRLVPVLHHWIIRRTDQPFGGAARIAAAMDPYLAAAYGGRATEQDAEARRADLLYKHLHQRPCVIVVNPKREEKDRSLVELIRRQAAADSPERLAQVDVISPRLGTSIDSFDIGRDNADLGDSIRTAMEIIEGRANEHWTQQQAALITHMFSMLKATTPGRLNWLEILSLLQDQHALRDRVAAARDLLAKQVQAGDSVGLGVQRIDYMALDELSRFCAYDPRDWDRLVTHTLAFGRYMSSAELVQTMSPEVSTFGPWRELIQQGRIAIIDLPLDRHQNVGRALTTLMLAAVANAASEYGAETPAAQRRVTLVFVDEAPLFMNPLLESATAVGRSAGLGWFFAMQTHRQLDDKTPTAGATLRTTCANRWAYRDPDGEAAREKAATFGTRQQAVSSYSFHDRLSEPVAARQTTAPDQSGGTSISLREVPRFTAETIQSLPVGRAIVMLSGGSNSTGARLVSTPMVEQVYFLRDGERDAAGRLREIPPYVPPIPMHVIEGATPDRQTLDRVEYLVRFLDPTRDETLGLQTLTAESDGAVWGILLYNQRFAFAIEAAHLPALQDTLARAFHEPVKPGHADKLAAPTVILRDLQDGQRALDLLGIEIERPFPLREAAEALLSQEPHVRSTVEAHLTTLSRLAGRFRRPQGLEWHTVSTSLRKSFDVYRALQTQLAESDGVEPLELRDAWTSVLGRYGAPNLAAEPAEPPRHDGATEEATHTTPSEPAGPLAPRPRRRPTRHVDELTAMLAFMESAQLPELEVEPMSPAAPPGAELTHADPSLANRSPAGSDEPSVLELVVPDARHIDRDGSTPPMGRRSPPDDSPISGAAPPPNSRPSIPRDNDFDI